MPVRQISFKDSNLLKQTMQPKTDVQPSQADVQSTPQASVQQQPKDSSKKLAYVSAVVALASLGVTGVVAVKHGKFSKQLQDITKHTNNLAEETSSKIKQGIDALNDRITGLGKWQDGQIAGVKDDVLRALPKYEAKGAQMSDILLQPALINGKEMQLATVMHGYGKYTQELENTLRSESTKRLFGIVNRSNIQPKENTTIRIPTAEFRGFTSTGGMSIVPKELLSNLAGMINNKQKVRFVVDTPLYLGQVEEKTYYSLVKRVDGRYDYMSSSAKNPKLATLEKINTIQVPIYTDKGKTMETVDMFMAKNLEQEIEFDLLKPWLRKDLSEQIDKAVEKGETFQIDDRLKIDYKDVKILKNPKNPEEGYETVKKPIALVSYDTVFYKNDKFRMDGPSVNDTAKNIYNNLTHEAGETERFMYFDKYFYESLVKGAETSNENLTADLIIGNDWQTGGISAMMKLLTTARKYFGMDPKVADKLYNTPVMTILHNAELAGSISHSQPKLLNILFGEHSSVIARNAYMPQGSNLPADELNGLLHGHNFNPQTMAAVYSDVLVPVSKGYGHEIASYGNYGHANHDIFKMRAREFEFGNLDYLKIIASKNNLDPNLVTAVNYAYRPVANGCDRVNNVLNDEKARSIEEALGLEKNSIKVYDGSESVIDWHNHNKEVNLNKIKSDIDLARTGKENSMNIELPEMTDLSGVNKDTMVISNSGRITNQKGLDIFAGAIEEFLSRHKGEKNLPVFYIQGVGSRNLIDQLLSKKIDIARKYGQEAANRIVFARLFSEPGRFDSAKLISDFIAMPSWFEPRGLAHIEAAATSGAIPIPNKSGGLTEGLTDGVNAIFSEFRPNLGSDYQDALQYNQKAFADAIDKAYNIFNDKQKFADMIDKSYKNDNSWLKDKGAAWQYAKTLVDLNVLKPEVLTA